MFLPSTTRQRESRIKAILFEAVVAAMVGCALAFAANALSPRGLKIAYNYFPIGTNAVSRVQKIANSSPESGKANLRVGQDARQHVPAGSALPPQNSGNAEAANDAGNTNSSQTPKLISVSRLIDQGLQGIDYDQAVRFFQDPRRQKGLVVFVDARNERLYQEGHIPGAYLFDPYHSDKYLSAVLPVCQKAEQVVVYCVASECEDSQLAAVLLRKAGVANEKLFVYVSGYTEWAANHQPVETGARNSGNILNASE